MINLTGDLKFLTYPKHIFLHYKKFSYQCILNNIYNDADTSVISQYYQIISGNQYFSRALEFR